MSTVKTQRTQYGISTNPSNNFVVDASQADGTLKISRGNVGATTQDIIKVKTDGNLEAQGLPAFMCRAWVLFNGQPASPTIYASGNVASVSKISTGVYRVTFTTAMPSANYCVNAGGQFDEAATNAAVPCVGVRRNPGAQTTTTVDICTTDPFATTVGSMPIDCLRVSVSIYA
jgi:hypothetical protein